MFADPGVQHFAITLGMVYLGLCLGIMVCKYAILVYLEIRNLQRCHRRVTLAAIIHNLFFSKEA